jgi:phospholipid transport system substrate-binding protein
VSFRCRNKAIADASEKLQQRMQDKTFLKDFNKITQFVDQVLYPHVDFDKISALAVRPALEISNP